MTAPADLPAFLNISNGPAKHAPAKAWAGHDGEGSSSTSGGHGHSHGHHGAGKGAATPGPSAASNAGGNTGKRGGAGASGKRGGKDEGAHHDDVRSNAGHSSASGSSRHGGGGSSSRSGGSAHKGDYISKLQARLAAAASDKAPSTNAIVMKFKANTPTPTGAGPGSARGGQRGGDHGPHTPIVTRGGESAGALPRSATRWVPQSELRRLDGTTGASGQPTQQQLQQQQQVVAAVAADASHIATAATSAAATTSSLALSLELAEAREHALTAERGKVIKSVMAILNKLTPEKFEKLAGQALEAAAQCPDVVGLRQLVRVIFEKAVAELRFAALYARFCAALALGDPSFTDVDSYVAPTVRGPGTGGANVGPGVPAWSTATSLLCASVPSNIGPGPFLPEFPLHVRAHISTSKASGASAGASSSVAAATASPDSAASPVTPYTAPVASLAATKAAGAASDAGAGVGGAGAGAAGASPADTETFKKALLKECYKQLVGEPTHTLPPQCPPAFALRETDSAEERVSKLRSRERGTVVFMGELFRQCLLPRHVIYYIIDTMLLGYEGITTDDEVENVAELLRTVGPQLDGTDADLVKELAAQRAREQARAGKDKGVKQQQQGKPGKDARASGASAGAVGTANGKGGIKAPDSPVMTAAELRDGVAMFATALPGIALAPSQQTVTSVASTSSGTLLPDPAALNGRLDRTVSAPVQARAGGAPMRSNAAPPTAAGAAAVAATRGGDASSPSELKVSASADAAPSSRSLKELTSTSPDLGTAYVPLGAGFSRRPAHSSADTSSNPAAATVFSSPGQRESTPFADASSSASRPVSPADIRASSPTLVATLDPAVVARAFASAGAGAASGAADSGRLGRSGDVSASSSSSSSPLGLSPQLQVASGIIAPSAVRPANFAGGGVPTFPTSPVFTSMPLLVGASSPELAAIRASLPFSFTSQPQRVVALGPAARPTSRTSGAAGALNDTPEGGAAAGSGIGGAGFVRSRQASATVALNADVSVRPLGAAASGARTPVTAAIANLLTPSPLLRARVKKESSLVSVVDETEQLESLAFLSGEPDPAAAPAAASGAAPTGAAIGSADSPELGSVVARLPFTSPAAGPKPAVGTAAGAAAPSGQAAEGGFAFSTPAQQPSQASAKASGVTGAAAATSSLQRVLKMSEYFAALSRLADAKRRPRALAARLRFMLQDLIALRRNAWGHGLSAGAGTGAATSGGGKGAAKQQLQRLGDADEVSLAGSGGRFGQREEGPMTLKEMAVLHAATATQTGAAVSHHGHHGHGHHGQSQHHSHHGGNHGHHGPSGGTGRFGSTGPTPSRDMGASGKGANYDKYLERFGDKPSVGKPGAASAVSQHQIEAASIAGEGAPTGMSMLQRTTSGRTVTALSLLSETPQKPGSGGAGAAAAGGKPQSMSVGPSKQFLSVMHPTGAGAPVSLTPAVSRVGPAHQLQQQHQQQAQEVAAPSKPTSSRRLGETFAPAAASSAPAHAAAAPPKPAAPEPEVTKPAPDSDDECAWRVATAGKKGVRKVTMAATARAVAGALALSRDVAVKTAGAPEASAGPPRSATSTPTPAFPAPSTAVAGPGTCGAATPAVFVVSPPDAPASNAGLGSATPAAGSVTAAPAAAPAASVPLPFAAPVTPEPLAAVVAPIDPFERVRRVMGANPYDPAPKVSPAGSPVVPAASSSSSAALAASSGFDGAPMGGPLLQPYSEGISLPLVSVDRNRVEAACSRLVREYFESGSVDEAVVSARELTGLYVSAARSAVAASGLVSPLGKTPPIYKTSPIDAAAAGTSASTGSAAGTAASSAGVADLVTTPDRPRAMSMTPSPSGSPRPSVTSIAGFTAAAQDWNEDMLHIIVARAVLHAAGAPASLARSVIDRAIGRALQLQRGGGSGGGLSGAASYTQLASAVATNAASRGAGSDAASSSAPVVTSGDEAGDGAGGAAAEAHHDGDGEDGPTRALSASAAQAASHPDRCGAVIRRLLLEPPTPASSSYVLDFSAGAAANGAGSEAAAGARSGGVAAPGQGFLRGREFLRGMHVVLRHSEALSLDAPRFAAVVAKALHAAVSTRSISWQDAMELLSDALKLQVMQDCEGDVAEASLAYARITAAGSAQAASGGATATAGPAVVSLPASETWPVRVVSLIVRDFLAGAGGADHLMTVIDSAKASVAANGAVGAPAADPASPTAARTCAGGSGTAISAAKAANALAAFAAAAAASAAAKAVGASKTLAKPGDKAANSQARQSRAESILKSLGAGALGGEAVYRRMLDASFLASL